MKIIEEIKKELIKSSKSLLKDVINLPEIEEKKEKEEFLIFEEGKSSFTFDIEETGEKREEIEDIVNLIKTGQYDKAIEKIRELKSRESFGIGREEIEL
ncbi:MAG: hypothetical protein ABIN15_06265 [candidate division WOR-3 bacterium]